MKIAALVRRVQRGEPGAFEELVEECGDQAFKTAYLVLGRRDLAEDAAQEALIRCYLKIKELRDPQAFPAWFCRLLTRTCWELARKNRSGAPELPSMRELATGSDPVGEGLEMEEDRRRLRQALAKLDPRMRAVLVLRYFNELSLREMAEVLGIPEGTVKSRLHHALRRLAAELNGTDPLPTGKGKKRGGVYGSESF
ncbi:RNA polymerase sigma factor [Desulfothermobacter acidiphilus]|uniref:RNA polymerase sigma factor n=1 Tax=Desulfothermobacter acidiphilus TaxID=1938353 RepID=UPI003F8C4B96